MPVMIALVGLILMMIMSYRNHSVIIVATVAAIDALGIVNSSSVALIFPGVFLEKMPALLKPYLTVLSGSLLTKVVETSRSSGAIIAAAIRYFGRSKANIIALTACAPMLYGGASDFAAKVVFVAHLLAAKSYCIPKRLKLGTPQTQNIIPTTFFDTASCASPAIGKTRSVIARSCKHVKFFAQPRAILACDYK